MKRFYFALVFALAGISVYAQSKFSGKLVPATQAVLNSVVSHPDVIIITGRLIDVASSNPIANAKLNVAQLGEGIINAAVDEKGNYALAIDKSKVDAKSKLVFKVNGYDASAPKRIRKDIAFVDMDVRLTPDESSQPLSGKYVMNDEPFSPLVIKF